MHLGSDIFMMCRRTESFTIGTMRQVALYYCSSIESEEIVVMTLVGVLSDAPIVVAPIDVPIAEDPAVAPIASVEIIDVVVLEDDALVVV